ncbi:MAG: UvrD-helicase domain-containing protein [Clostridia bacterium]|nr:UvrD-helicase domain-containing protein [Clostridia bacterium]
MLKYFKTIKKGDAMAETRWTDEQLSAIETRDKTLLVSAAAGSGKTATLTERIIRSLLDEAAPMNIDSLLVVTFTNAAASELRAKISRALTSAVEKNPENKHLKRQLYLLPSAKIRTIDSFCNEILRANCDRVGVPPSYRIADTAECELLAISIIEGLIEAVYNGEVPEVASPTEFEELCDCLTDSKRTEELAGVFRYIHLKCESAEEGVDLLGALCDRYLDLDSPVEENVYGSFLMARYRDMLDHYLGAYSRYMKAFSSGLGAEGKYLDTLLSDRVCLEKLRSAVSYDEAREAISAFSLVRLASVKSADKTADMESFALLRKMMKAEILKMQKLFAYTSPMWRDLFASLHKLLAVLYRFESKFDELFSEEKRRLGALSYADIERYTYKCLINDGEITDIARNVASQFDAIYIDEYQDVNSLQNRIFEAISKPNNRFMVGDIKQSIYGFRSARPEIFAEMKSSFPHISIASGDAASIFMSRNFRCDKAVVDFVNDIFDRAFGFVSGSIGYSTGDRLGYAKMQERGEPEYRYPEICMIDKHAEGEENREAEVVAAKISELLKNGVLNNGQPIRPSDVAIIMRNAKDKDVRYAAALERIGIPSCISGAKDFFLTPEVLLTLCLLNSIDNPRRDIYLAGLMCSPLFSFTADELYLIRLEKCETLYESLVKYVKCNEEFTKGRDFLEKLGYYRAISEGVGVDTLIYKLYRETGLMTLASNNGGKENLTLLYDYARSYEAGSFKGLYNFISFINSIIDKKTSFDDTRAKAEEDAVKIVTCHASKGLEYPVVFLVGSSGRLVNKERNSRLAFSEGFGIAFRLRTPSGLAPVDNPVRDIINLEIDRRLYEEELRVLYVALTRARERLFVIGECPKTKREEYESELSVISENLSEYSFRELDSYMEISLCCLNKRGLCEEEFVGEISERKTDSGLSVEATEIIPERTDAKLKDELCRRFEFEYPSPHMTLLPEKMSVSLMSPTVLDGTDGECVRLDAPEEEKRRVLPAFALGSSADESAKRGIATHLVMQFCDLERLDRLGAKEELGRLEKDGFISKEDAERVRLREIEMFRKSKLFSEMLNAKKVWRELRFNVLLPASEFTEDDEKIKAYFGKDILVQGVIDCIIERTDGSLILCDYKTDRLTKEELSNRGLAEEKLRNKHAMQLGLYSLAIERIFEKTPSEVKIYSLPLGDTVSVK